MVTISRLYASSRGVKQCDIFFYGPVRYTGGAPGLLCVSKLCGQSCYRGLSALHFCQQFLVPHLGAKRLFRLIFSLGAGSSLAEDEGDE